MILPAERGSDSCRDGSLINWASGKTSTTCFLASDKQLRPNRNGNLYLQLRLSDRTGSVNAMMWNANDRIYQAFHNGDYVHVQGTSQVYNGNLQIIVTQIDAAEPGNIDEADFRAPDGCTVVKPCCNGWRSCCDRWKTWI